MARVTFSGSIGANKLQCRLLAGGNIVISVAGQVPQQTGTSGVLWATLRGHPCHFPAAVPADASALRP